MSPEQLECASDVDVRADIWALGVVLYELLMGVPPFQGDTIPQLVAAVLQAAPVRPLDDSVPAELGEVVLRALAKRRDERFGSVAELAQALGPFAPALARTSISRVRRLLESRSPTLPHAPELSSDDRPGSYGRSVTPIQEAKSAADTTAATGLRGKALWIGVGLGISVALLVLVLRQAVFDRDANTESKAAEAQPTLQPASPAQPASNLEAAARRLQAGTSASPTLVVAPGEPEPSSARPLAGAQSNVAEPTPVAWPRDAHGDAPNLNFAPRDAQRDTQDEAQVPGKPAPRSRVKLPPSAADVPRAKGFPSPSTTEATPDQATPSRISDFGGRR
jgi:serine/threonine-protein kinase